MKVSGINLKKIVLNSLIVIVSLLVLFAFYSSKDKFAGFNILKYRQIQLSTETNIAQIAEKYTDPENMDRFIAEVKRINDLESSEFLTEKNLMIPVFDSD